MNLEENEKEKKVRGSENRGDNPVWRRDAKELAFYNRFPIATIVVINSGANSKSGDALLYLGEREQHSVLLV